MKDGLHTVHVRVNDSATGQPTPVRIRFSATDGTYFPPFGRLSSFSTKAGEDVGGNIQIGAERYAYIDGTCEVRLPTGPVLIKVCKGPEYLPAEQKIELGKGQLAVRLSIDRWTDLRRNGWYSGDIHAYFLSPHAAMIEGAAENLAVVNLLAVEYTQDLKDFFARFDQTGTCHSISNILAFSGQRPALEMPGHIVVVNSHNYHPLLGHLALLNCHRLVFPLRFGGSDGLEDWRLADWCDQCHRKGGLVVWLEPDPDQPGECLADLIIGKVDAFASNFESFDLWYQLLNCGFQIPLAAGSAKASNATPLGKPRTYGGLGSDEAFTYRGWIEAVRNGRSYVTTGPLIRLSVNGFDIGSVVNGAAEGDTLTVRAEGRSIVPFAKLEIVLNGKVVGQANASGTPAEAVIETTLPVSGGGWITARCMEHATDAFHDDLIVAHTSPVYIQVEGKTKKADRESIVKLTGCLDTMIEKVGKEGRFESDGQKERLETIFQSARQELAKRLE